LTHHAYNQNVISRSNVHFKYLDFYGQTGFDSIPVGHVTKHFSFIFLRLQYPLCSKGGALSKSSCDRGPWKEMHFCYKTHWLDSAGSRSIRSGSFPTSSKANTKRCFHNEILRMQICQRVNIIASETNW